MERQTSSPDSSETGRHPLQAAGLGFAIHTTLWIVFIAVLLTIHRRDLFPTRPSITLAILAILLLTGLFLWIPGRFRGIALMTLNLLSLITLSLMAAEAYISWTAARPVEVTRYPFPYRMHAFTPLMKDTENRYHATTNDTGIRASHSIKRKRPGCFRVLVLGGSAIFGVGSGDADTIPVGIEKLLKEHHQHNPLAGIGEIEVINAGQGWYNSTNELVYFVTELALYEPDLVVVIDGYNDAHHSMAWNIRPPANSPTYNFLTSLYYAPGTFEEGSWANVVTQAIGASWVAKRLALVPGKVMAPPLLAQHGPVMISAANAVDFRWSMKHRLIMNWTIMDRLCGQFHCPVLFSLQPCIFAKTTLTDSEKHWIATQDYSASMTQIWADLEAYALPEARRLNLKVFNSDRHMRDCPSPLFTDYCHLNLEGNQLAAGAAYESIADILKQWPWKVDWDGVRYPFEQGDPIWRPHALTRQDPWQ